MSEAKWESAENPISFLRLQDDDIRYAQRQDRWSCAIVRAIQRVLPDALFVRADTEKIAYSVDGHRYEHNTPPSAVTRIIRPLDQHEEVEPGIGFHLGPATVRQVQRMTSEEKRHVRAVRRGEVARKSKSPGKPKGAGTRTHDRFCE